MITIIIPEWLLWIVGILYIIQITMLIWNAVVERRNNKQRELYDYLKNVYQEKIKEYEDSIK